MTERPRFYLTTAIAYANNKPGLHTLYEVVGADVVPVNGAAASAVGRDAGGAQVAAIGAAGHHRGHERAAP